MEHHTLKSRSSDILLHFMADRLVAATKRRADSVRFHHSRENIALTFTRDGNNWYLAGWGENLTAPTMDDPPAGSWISPIWKPLQTPIQIPTAPPN